MINLKSSEFVRFAAHRLLSDKCNKLIDSEKIELLNALHSGKFRDMPKNIQEFIKQNKLIKCHD